MLALAIRKLGEKYNITTVKFEKIFRDNALGKRVESDYTGRTDISADEYNGILTLKKQFGDLFFEKDSHYLFWICKCLYLNEKSLLASLNEYIGNVCTVKRGGLNTYKLNGWDAHILYVYQLTNFNFPNCIIPSAYNWDFDVEYIFSHFMDTYNKLSVNSRFILRIGSFLHDIGVTLGVKDHEAKGVPLTEKYYNELFITTDLLASGGITLQEHEIIIAVRAIVGNHQIVNQIAAEVSDRYIFEKINEIKNSFSVSDRLMNIFDKDFAGIMSVLAISDMMAVDDSLLQREKYLELADAYKFMSNIINNNSYNRDPQKYGIRRLVSLLQDNLKSSAEQVIAKRLSEMNDKGQSIINFLYEVKFLSYAMAAIKPLGNIDKSLKLIEICSIARLRSELPLSDTIFKFDPDIETDKLSVILDKSTHDIVTGELIDFTFNRTECIIEVTCK